MNLIKKILSKVFIYTVMLFTVTVSLFPIIWVVSSSFKTNGQILTQPFGLPTALDFSPYVKVFTQYNFTVYTLNSLFIAVVATLFALMIYALAAYVLAKFNFKGKSLFFILFTLTLLVPGHTKAQPIFSLILNLNLYDTRLALILVYLSNGMALSIFILKAAYQTVPKEMSEAALIDGASFWQIFSRIHVPLVKSGLVTAGILMFLGNWNEYFYAMLLTSSKATRTLPLALGFFTETFSYNYTEMFAALTIVIIPSIIIYTLAQEQIQKSVASSGVKG
ncbi:MAG: carbohydrate ABC transporter permease [Clostridiales bacterium]|nr:carbohydrate ABC transporter permease [Clostridiales bacterium]